MPTLRICVKNMPPGFDLTLQTKAGPESAAQADADSREFIIPFEWKANRKGEVHPAGDAVEHHGDGRRFVYLAWHRGGTPVGRMKVFFDQFECSGDTCSVTVSGTDSKGRPACATARVLP
jgi:hypothetical protein